jgi:hypothetical protein
MPGLYYGHKQNNPGINENSLDTMHPWHSMKQKQRETREQSGREKRITGTNKTIRAQTKRSGHKQNNPGTNKTITGTNKTIRAQTKQSGHKQNNPFLFHSCAIRGADLI